MGKKKEKPMVKQEKVKQVVQDDSKELLKQEVPDETKELLKQDEIKIEPKVEDPKGSQRNRKARLIVRNLSFKAADVNIRKFFKPYGEITDIKILKKPDGRLVGCCFVEFSQTTSAAKAIAHASGKPLLHRPVVVDWAIAKDKFLQKNSKPGTEDSEESGFHEDEDDKSKVLDDSKIKKEDSDSDDSEENGKGSEDEEDDESEDDHEMEVDDDDDENGGDGGESDDLDDSEDDSDEDKKKNVGRRKPLRESHDISEGCTVFVKNIPFSVDNEEFKNCMKKFGPVYYALVCVDHLTEHSKGSGFVKFRSQEHAEACLTAGKAGEINLDGSVVETVPAVSRDDLKNGTKKLHEAKDGRNLYLIKEGVILAGSPAATGVSATDMAKRLQMEQWKTQMLRNLNKYVSRNRLVIQNLPPSYDDLKLRGLFLKFGGTKPVITEARVMRNLRDIDETGKGRPKGYGFVTFTTHENALHALRTINNNPTIFTPVQRPIVAFSIEDKKVANIRQKRLERSKTALQRSQTKRLSQKDWEAKRQAEKQEAKGKKQGPGDKKSSAPVDAPQPSENPTQEDKKLTRKERRKLRKQKLIEKWQQRSQAEKPTVTTTSNEGSNFMGEQAREGQTGLTTKRKIREQAKIFQQTRKDQNREERKRKRLAATQTKLKQPKQAKSKVKAKAQEAKDSAEDNFSHLVDKYRSQLVSHVSERKKWYDE